MKKLLLLSAACIGLFSSNAAIADDKPAIELQVGGFMNFYGTYANQRRTTNVLDHITLSPLTYYYDTIEKYNSFDVMGNAEIYFSGTATLDNGVKIGAMVQLEAGTDSDTSNHTIDETYLFIDSKIGKLMVGNIKNVTNMMAVTAPTVSTIGLQETDFKRMVVVPFQFAYNKATYATLDDISTKLSYISPTMGGFTVGISLMPGNKTKGKDADNLLNGNDGLKTFKYGMNAIALYEHDFGKFDISASAEFSTYRPNFRINGISAKEKETHEFGGGLNIGFGNWTIGGSYHYVNASDEASELAYAAGAQSVHGYVWDAGISYIAGAFETSASFLQSRADSFVTTGKDIYNLYQLSFKYKIRKGIDLFTDAAYVEYDADDSARSASNKGTAVAVGVNLNF